MYVYGSECTLTLVLGNAETALPYSFETIREELQEDSLNPLVDDLRPLVFVPIGNEALLVLGCVVTRICLDSFEKLALVLLQGFCSSFCFYLNRVVEQRIYHNLLLTGWEVRAERDKAVFIRFDIKGCEAIDWDYTTKNLPWKQNETLHFYDGDLTFDGIPSNNVYRVALTQLYDAAVSTILQIHYPILLGDILNTARSFQTITLTFGKCLRFILTNAVLLSFIADTDNCDEILVVRQFRIDGKCNVEVCDNKGVWVVPA